MFTSFFRALNSPGGRIAVLIFLIVLSLAAELFKIPYAKEMVLGTLTATLTQLSRQSGNSTQGKNGG